MEKIFNKKNKIHLPQNFYEFVILLNCIVFFAIRDIPVLLYGVQGLLIITTICMNWNKKIRMFYVIYAILFMGWILTSFLWAESIENALKFAREIIQMLVMCFCIATYCTNYENIEKIIDFIYIALYIMVIYILIKTPINEWSYMYQYNINMSTSTGRLGNSVGYHPNSMAKLCYIGMLVFLYYLKNKKGPKTINALMFLIYTILMLFTKSRSGLLNATLMIMFFLVLGSRKTIIVIKKLVVVLGILIFALWAIFNIKFLYDLVGFRFEGILGFFDTSYEIDASVNGRDNLIEVGKQIIKDHPIIGVGAGNYANIAYKDYNLYREVYAHSNIIELWANLGIIGLGIYYFIRLYVIYKMIVHWKDIPNEKKLMFTMLQGFLVSTTIFDYINMTYSCEHVQIIQTICFCLIFNKEILRRNEINKITLKKL